MFFASLMIDDIQTAVARRMRMDDARTEGEAIGFGDGLIIAAM